MNKVEVCILMNCWTPTFFCLFSRAFVCLRISIRNKVSSKAFSFFTSGQGASTRTWRLGCTGLHLLSPPHHLPWSPACEGWSYTESSLLCPDCRPPTSHHVTSSLSTQMRPADLRGKSSSPASAKPCLAGRRLWWWRRLMLTLTQTL